MRAVVARRRFGGPINSSSFISAVLALSLSGVALRASAEPIERDQAPGTGGKTAAAVEAPRPREPLSAPYPTGAAGEALVVLELVIESNGAVTEARVVSGAEPFSGAALDAADAWQFIPARRAGRPVQARIRLEIRFTPPAPRDPNPPDEAEAPGETGETESDGQNVDRPIEVVVSGTREPESSTISAAEVRELPGAFGDPFRALEILPGVTPVASGLPYFYVRGAPPGNVGYYLDGVRVPGLFHAAVGPSVIHPAFIDSVTLYPGPYPARYGHFAGGIVAAETAPPAYRWRGEASVRLVDAGGLIEAPLGGEQTDVMLAGRYSYSGLIVSAIVPEVDIAYWDYQGRIVHRIDARQTLTLFGFGAYDFAAQLDRGRMLTTYDVTFHRLELRLDRSTAGGGHLRLAATGGLDRSRSELRGFRVGDDSAGVRADFERPFGRTRLRVGSEARLDVYDTTQDVRSLGNEFLGDFAQRFPDRRELLLGGYVEALFEPEPGVRVTAGVRGDLYASSEQDFGVSPRVSAEFDLSDRLTLTNALGVAQQPPSFAIPVPGLTPVAGGGLQTSLQSSAGLRLTLPESLSASVTLFQSVFLDATDALGVSRLDNGDFTLSQSSRSLGSARGVELMLKRSLSERVGGFLSYTLSRSERALGRASGPSSFDRTHVLNLALAVDLGSGYRAGARAAFYTGIPGDVAYVEAARHPPRTPPFYRFDWRVEKRWNVGTEGAFWALVLEVLNTTFHRETINQSCNAYTCREEVIGPVTVPSIGVEAAF